MMIVAKGPVWHHKDKRQGRIPVGVDQDATWCTSRADGWVYGHGAFSVVAHTIPVLGCFVWMPNSAHEAKRLWLETGSHIGQLTAVVMDAKADDSALFREFQRQRQMTLVTRCRTGMDKTPERQQMIQALAAPQLQQYLKERSQTVEPMQGLVKDIVDLDRCWMRGNHANRWLFAAMGVTIQMHQLDAYRAKRSTWTIKSAVLGVG